MHVQTETDTINFGSTNVKSNSLGKSTKFGQTKISAKLVSNALKQSKGSVANVAPGGTVSGQGIVITTDGGPPFVAAVDPTAKGNFRNSAVLKVASSAPGARGNTNPIAGVSSDTKKTFTGQVGTALEAAGLAKRAKNVGAEFVSLPTSPPALLLSELTGSPWFQDFQIQMPADLDACTGKVEGVATGVCLMKIQNTNPAGGFGNMFFFTMDAAGNGTAAAAPAANENAKRRVKFEA